MEKINVKENLYVFCPKVRYERKKIKDKNHRDILKTPVISCTMSGNMQHTPVKNNVVTSQITTKKITEFDHMVIVNAITTPCADPVEEEPESQSVLETLNDCHDFCMTALRSSSYDSDECFTMMVNAVEHAIMYTGGGCGKRGGVVADDTSNLLHHMPIRCPD